MTKHPLPLLLLLAGATSVVAAGASAQDTPRVVDERIDAPLETAALGLASTDYIVEPASATPSVAQQPAWARYEPQSEPRPKGLVAMYGTFVALQALDAHSTLRAVDSGYAESNPLVAPFLHEPGAMLAFKTSTTILTILAVERLGKRHRAAALGLMIGANVGYALVVAHNYGR